MIRFLQALGFEENPLYDCNIGSVHQGDSVLKGTLFTEDFLREGIAETEAWKALDDEAIHVFLKAARGIFDAFPTDKKPNEAQTEDDLIWKILDLVGWSDYLRQ